MRHKAKLPLMSEAPRQVEAEITTDEVNRLDGGSTVKICGNDKAGVYREVSCTVAMWLDAEGKCQRFLTYRMGGKMMKCKIRDYPGKVYKRA